MCRFHYGADAVLRDPEQSEIITQLLKGTATIPLSSKNTSSCLISVYDTRTILGCTCIKNAPPPPHTHTHYRPLLIPAGIQLHWCMAEHVGPIGSGTVWYLDTTRTHLHQTKQQKYVKHRTWSNVLLTTHRLQHIACKVYHDNQLLWASVSWGETIWPLSLRVHWALLEESLCSPTRIVYPKWKHHVQQVVHNI